MTSLPTILLILAAISIGAAVIAALIALRSARESRSAIFPIVREEESVRARRARISIWGWLALTALFLGGWLATLRLTPAGNASPISDAISVQADQTVGSASPTEMPGLAQIESTPTGINRVVEPTRLSIVTPTSITSPPSASSPLTPTATTTQPSPPSTATPTQTATPPPPTPTPTSLADAVRLPPAAPRTPAPPRARMGPIQFGTDITPDIEVVNPGTLFPEDIEAVYAVYPFSGMTKGLDFTAVWYKNGLELAREEEQWQFGDQARSYRYLVPSGQGLYKLELYVNDTVMATALFEIR